MDTIGDITEEDITALSDDGRVKVVWTDLGEGLDGDYNPDDSDDIALLRFDTYVRLGDAERDLEPVDDEWGIKPDSSFCTNMPVDTDPAVLTHAARHIANELTTALDAGHWKTTIEGLSWIGPDDVPTAVDICL